MHVVGQLDLQLTRRVERLAVAQARYDELKQISAKDGSTLMSNSTFEYVAENATEGQFAFFKDVLDNEFELRRASRIARLKRGADFPFQKSFDGFEWDGIGFPSGFTREDMLSLGFVDRHEDLVLFGDSDNGKSHTAVALGILACGMGKRVKFSSTSRLVNELNEANAEGRIAAMLKGLARNDMIILDEWGYLPTDPDGARLLFRVVSMCYERIPPDPHDQHRVLEMGRDLQRRRYGEGHDGPDSPPWEAGDVREGELQDEARADARRLLAGDGASAGTFAVF